MTPDPDRERARLVENLRSAGVFRDARVAHALGRVPRHAFVPASRRAEAYADAPVPLPEGQTVSAPHIVAMMAEALDVRPGARVLEVGGGSGYHAAVLAELASPGGRVWSIERRASLAAGARRALDAAGYARGVTVVEGDGSLGLPGEAPFDRVSVACAVPAFPPPLLDQLAPGGRLVAPVGPIDAQTLFAVEKSRDGALGSRPLVPCRFVPLVGAHGFTDR